MVTAAAKLLGMSARQLSRRLKGRDDLRPLVGADPVWQRAYRGSDEISKAYDPIFRENTQHEYYQQAIDFDDYGARSEPRVLTEAELEDVIDCYFGQKEVIIGPLRPPRPLAEDESDE